MATRLKDTDVVVIGLGAAGGVAVLPLAQAGLEVIGLEAGGARVSSRRGGRENPVMTPCSALANAIVLYAVFSALASGSAASGTFSHVPPPSPVDHTAFG